MTAADAPYWALLPRWLAAASPERARRRVGGSLLRDIERGQTALFHAIRLHDDLFDGDAPDLSYVLRGDRELVEAERRFARHLPRHADFWSFYREALDRTLRGIDAVAALEKKPGAFTRPSLRLHARVASIFKVGSAAFLAAQGRLEAVRSLDPFTDSLAVAGQILDDIRDLRSDLKRGRHTFVANLLLAGSRPLELAGAFDEVRRRLDTAARCARGLALPAASAHVAAWLCCVESLETRCHHLRVDAFFAPLLRRS